MSCFWGKTLFFFFSCPQQFQHPQHAWNTQTFNNQVLNECPQLQNWLGSKNYYFFLSRNKNPLHLAQVQRRFVYTLWSHGSSHYVHRQVLAGLAGREGLWSWDSIETTPLLCSLFFLHSRRLPLICFHQNLHFPPSQGAPNEAMVLLAKQPQFLRAGLPECWNLGLVDKLTSQA